MTDLNKHSGSGVGGGNGSGSDHNYELSTHDIQQIIDLALDDKDKRGRIDYELHFQHHDFLSELIEERRIRRERCNAVITQVSGWGAVGLILWIGQAIAKKIGVVF